jgi:hypothetical protein
VICQGYWQIVQTDVYHLEYAYKIYYIVTFRNTLMLIHIEYESYWSFKWETEIKISQNSIVKEKCDREPVMLTWAKVG